MDEKYERKTKPLKPLRFKRLRGDGFEPPTLGYESDTCNIIQD